MSWTSSSRRTPRYARSSARSSSSGMWMRESRNASTSYSCAVSRGCWCERGRSEGRSSEWPMVELDDDARGDRVTVAAGDGALSPFSVAMPSCMWCSVCRGDGVLLMQSEVDVGQSMPGGGRDGVEGLASAHPGSTNLRRPGLTPAALRLVRLFGTATTRISLLQHKHHVRRTKAAKQARAQHPKGQQPHIARRRTASGRAAVRQLVAGPEEGLWGGSRSAERAADSGR